MPVHVCVSVCLRARVPGQVFCSVSSLPQKDIKTASWLGHLAVVAPLFSTVVILHGEFLACCSCSEMPLALVAKTCDAALTTRHTQQKTRKRIGHKGPFIVYGIVAVRT